VVSDPNEVDEVAPTNDGQIDATQIHANVQPEASDVLPGIAIDTEQTNDDGSDATQIHATVQPEAIDVRRGIAIDTVPTNTGQIDAIQIHANVQLEEIPDIATIRSYTCPCQCEDDHEHYELQQPSITYHDWIASNMGSPYGHGCIPSAFLRMTQARLDFSAAKIMADTSIYEQRVYWLQQARTRLYRATSDYTRLSERCHCAPV
jgi:hypothetical protein